MEGEVCEWAGELLVDAGGVGWVGELEDSDVGIMRTSLSSSSFSEKGHETWSCNYICTVKQKFFNQMKQKKFINKSKYTHIYVLLTVQYSKRTRFE